MAKGWKFGFGKLINCTIPVAKINALITAKLIGAFVFAYAKCWVSLDADNICLFVFRFNVSVNNFSVMLGRSYFFFCINMYSGD